MGSTSSTKTNNRPLPDSLVVGRVLGPHGVQGEVSVELLGDRPERLEPGRRLLAVPAAGRETIAGGGRWLTVAACRWHRGLALVSFEEVADRSAAEVLGKVTLEIETTSLPPAPEEAFYHHELLGCRCVDARAGEIGTVARLIEDGGGLLLVVEGERGEIPVPFVKAFLRRVDVAGGLIELDLPEDLIALCASR